MHGQTFVPFFLCHPANLVSEALCGCCYVLLRLQSLSGHGFWQAGLLALCHDSIAPLQAEQRRRAFAAFPLRKHRSEVIVEMVR